VFLGQQIARSGAISPDTAKKIEELIRGLIDDAYKKAHEILGDTHNDDWIKLSEGLLEYETLTGAEIKALLEGKAIVRDDPEEPSGPPPSSVPSSGAPKSGPLGGAEPQGA